MTLIKISEDGLMGKVKNPFDNLFTGGAYNSGHTTEYWEFDKANPSYPLTEPGEPNCEVEGKLVWQYKFMDLDWLICIGLYNKKQCDHSGIPTRQAWQVSKTKVETPHTAEVTEQIIEELALKRYPEGMAMGVEMFHNIKNWDMNKDKRNAFISGANHILTSKGMVELDKVVDLFDYKATYTKPDIVRLIKTLNK